MALKTQVAAPARYQGASYRSLLQELKVTRNGGTTLISLAGVPRSSTGPIAQEIAGSLGRTIYRVDLKNVVSKFIGETEKNLRNLFKTLESAQWVLFFDEAESLFGKRSEVKDSHDRYANSEANYFANVLAGFGGVVVVSLTHPGPEIATQGRVRHVRVKFPPD